jgi:hypothetical protein
MKENNIDKLFKEKLAKHQVMPPPKAWDKINNSLNRKKRRAMIAWRMAAGVALVGGLSWWFVQQNFYKNSNNNSNHNNIAKLQTQKDSFQIEKNQVTENQANNIAKIENKQSKIVEKEVANEKFANSQTEKTNSQQKQIANKSFTKNNQKTIKQSLQELQEVENVEKNVAKNVLETGANNIANLTKVDSTTQKNALTHDNIIIAQQTIIATQETETETENTNLVEVIVKVGAETETKNPAKKRTFLNKIWNKVKEGEAITLKDVGVNTKKITNFLKQED